MQIFTSKGSGSRPSWATSDFFFYYQQIFSITLTHELLHSIHISTPTSNSVLLLPDLYTTTTSTYFNDFKRLARVRVAYYNSIPRSKSSPQSDAFDIVPQFPSPTLHLVLTCSATTTQPLQIFYAPITAYNQHPSNLRESLPFQYYQQPIVISRQR